MGGGSAAVSFGRCFDSGFAFAQHDRGGGGIPLVCRLRLVCHPETAGCAAGFHSAKLRLFPVFPTMSKSELFIIRFGRRRIVAACSPVVSVCIGGTASLRCLGMCGAGMPHLLCAFPVGVPAITFAGVPAITFAGVPAITFAGVPAITFAGGTAITFAGVPAITFAGVGYPKVPCPLSSSSSPPGVTVPLP